MTHCYNHKWRRIGLSRSHGQWWWRFRCRLCAAPLSFGTKYAPASISADYACDYDDPREHAERPRIAAASCQADRR